MGDRVVIYVKEASAAAYMHWHGEHSVGMLKRAIPSMLKGDPDYATARLIASLCSEVPGPAGVGVLPAPEDMSRNTLSSPDKYSHGDAGVIVYDCDTGLTEFFGGYLAREFTDGLDLSAA